MTGPILRKNNRSLTQRSSASSSSPKKSNIPRLDWYTPQTFKANVTEHTDREGQTLPLYSLVGDDYLEPFVWISMEGKQGTRQEEEGFSPLRRGLEFIFLKNQYNKYPMLELGITVPQYRAAGGASNQESGTIDDLVRPLEELKIGARFYIQWGYLKANIRWGAFTIVEREIEFNQGTAMLTIKAKMGAKMSSTTSSEVFSGTLEDNLQAIAKETGQSMSLGEATDTILSASTTVTPSGSSFGNALTRLAATHDLEVAVDAVTNTLILSDPFKLDLVKKGYKPQKMTYGFPSSPIESLDIETKRPKRAGTGPRSGKGAIPTGGGIDTKSRTGESYVKGSVVTKNAEGQFIYQHFGYPGTPNDRLPGATFFEEVSAFSEIRRSGGTTTRSMTNVIKNAEDKWKPSEGYVVALNTQLNNNLPPGRQGYYHVLVSKRVKISGNIVRTKNSLQRVEGLTKGSAAYNDAVKAHWVSSQDLENIYIQGVYKNGLIYRIQGSAHTVEGVEYFPIEVFKAEDQVKRAQARTDAQKQQNYSSDLGDSNEENPVTTTTQTISYETGQDREYELAVSNLSDRIKDIKVPKKVLDAYNNAQDKKQFIALNRTSPWFNDLQAFAAAGLDIDQTIKGIPAYSKRVEIGQDNYVRYQIVKDSPREPEEGAQRQTKTNNTADSASVDGQQRISLTPASVSSGIGRPSSRLSLTTLRIKLKAGDWTMRVGKLIEIVDVYKTVDGVYYIDSEEHRIDENGFHTVITCKVASSRQKTRYGRSALGKRGNRRATSGDERQDVQDAQSKQSTRSSSIVIEDSQTLQNRRIRDSKQAVVSEQNKRELTKARSKMTRTAIKSSASIPLGF